MLQFIVWNPEPVAVDLGIMAFRWYGLSWAAGLLWSFFVQRYVLSSLKMNDELLTLAIQYIFVGGLIGARMAQVIFYEPHYFLENPLKVIAVWEGGLASHGGVIGVIAGGWLFSKRYPHFPFTFLFDVGLICAFGFSALVRLGNLANSEIIGHVTDVPWAFIFVQVDDLPRHPVVLYESIAYAALQIVALILFIRYKISKPGIYCTLFFLGVFSIRLVLEFFKVPEGGMYFNLLSKTQLLNVPFIITGCVLLYLTVKGKFNYGFASHTTQTAEN